MPTNQLIATKKGLTQTSSLTTYINPFSTNVLLLYLLKTSENLRFFMFSGGIQWDIGWKWVNKDYWNSDITHTLIEIRLSHMTDDGKLEIKHSLGKTSLLD